MVFVAGPRQVGKTTLARSLAGAAAGYLNWDDPGHRERILKRELPRTDLWVFDEIHKYRKWRNYLKGLFDTRPPKQRILVTGSGRLDFYRFGGDSLQGRYHLLRLHPFVITERAQPKLIIEAKWSDTALDGSLRYLKAKFPKAEAWQISAVGNKDYLTPEGIRVAPSMDFLSQLI